MREKVLGYCSGIRNMQRRFKQKFNYTQTRFKYLRSYWEKEWEIYKFELADVPNDELNHAKYMQNKKILKDMEVFD
jgi:hypothetical protein